MKIQSLAVIAIILIVPMAIILGAYSTNQIKTLDLQSSYDSKLTNATYDAIKAFQLNMSNSSSSDIVNSKMRDIKASVNTFYNSLSSNFNMSGYGKDVLQEYVPAIVYTLYDGYYIYSAYDNTLDPGDKFDENAKYKNGEKIYGLKPYIYYSCRYKPNSTSDFVITYSLDSYITIQGTINGNVINDSGYLLTGVEKKSDGIYYRGFKIEREDDKEGLQQYVYVEKNTSGIGNKLIKVGDRDQYTAGSILKYPYKKINGVKYYQEGGNVFSIINEQKYPKQGSYEITKNNLGIKYYEDALAFRDRVNSYGLNDLKASNAADKNGKSMNTDTFYDYYIFRELNNTTGKYLEDEDSDFNAHKREVIKNVMETNLMSAIANYNQISTSQVNFAMPKLTEDEWDTITSNISMITFLQGLSIGGKIYNGYSIVPNNNNDEFVSENSIYMLYNGTYHRPTDKALLDKLGEGVNLTNNVTRTI